jgi:chemotaxis response regulator CheB
MTVRVLLVDDDAELRWVVARLLSDIPDVRVVGEAADGADAVRTALLTDPDVVVLDHAMPTDRAGRAAAVARGRTARPGGLLLRRHDR